MTAASRPPSQQEQQSPKEDETVVATTTATAPSSSLSPSSSSSPSFSAIIFDIDGTLANSWKLGYDATNQVLERHGIASISMDTYHKGTRYTTAERLARHAGHKDDDDDNDDDPSFFKVGQQLAREFDELYIGLVTTQTAGFYDGITSLLNRIQPTIKLGALTNAAVAYAHAVLRENSCATITNTNECDNSKSSWLYHRFQSIRGADNVPKPKPHPDGLWQVCQDFSDDDVVVKPSECVYIGDSPSDGVAALAAGMSFIGVTWGSHSRESLLSQINMRLGDNSSNNTSNSRVWICDSVSELEQVLDSLGVLMHQTRS